MPGFTIEKNLTDCFTGLLPTWSTDATHLALRLYRGLALGHPLPIADIADTMATSAARIRLLLDELGEVDYDETGAVIAYRGLTLRPTPHRVKIAGATLYTWCAFDALFLSAVVRCPLHIESGCPVSERRLALTIEGYHLAQVQPEGVVLSLRIPGSACYASDLRGAFCSFSHFFASRQLATDWLQGHADAVVFSLQEGLQLAQQRNRFFFAKFMDVQLQDG